MFRSSTDRTVAAAPPRRNEPEVEYFNCDFCSDGGWSSETEVDIHKTIKHIDDLIVLFRKNENVCKICMSPFKELEELQTHIRTDHLHSSQNAFRVERQVFICDYCNAIFFNKQLLEVHTMNSHLKLRGKSTECPKCGKLITFANIWFHFQSHGMQSVSSCRICFTKCNNRKDLREHMKKAHLKYLKCDMCSYQAKREELFHQHIEKNHKIKSETTVFDDVDKFFLPKGDPCWNGHMQTNCKGLQLTNGFSICVLCREICTDKQSRINHIILDHSTEYKIFPKTKHQCSCGEVFTNQVLLKHHVFKLKGNHQIC